MATLVHDTFGISSWITGAVLSALTALVILGGIKRIADVTAVLVPFMCLSYLAGAAIPADGGRSAY